MKKNIKIAIIFFVLFISVLADAKDIKPKYNSATIKVAVIDTGFDFESDWKKYTKSYPYMVPKLCNHGHKDFTRTGIKDRHGHGTHVAGIIAQHAKNSNYCLVILKVHEPGHKLLKENLVAKAVKYATKLGVDAINYSGGGESFDIYEYLAVKKALDGGILIVAAAGNEGKAVDYHVQRVKIKYSYAAKGEKMVYQYTPYFIHRKTSQIVKKINGHTYFPAAYDPRILAVQNMNKKGKLVKSSNRGAAFSHKNLGYEVISIKPNNTIGYHTGTSQAAPRRLGKILKSWKK